MGGIYLMISKLAKSYLGTTIPLVNISGVIRPQLYLALDAGRSLWSCV